MDAAGAIEQPEGRSVRLRHVLIPLVVAAIVYAAVLMLSLRLLPGAKPERTWSAADGTPAPSDFTFLMFPVDDKVPIFDGSREKSVGVLERAVGNDIGELKDSEWSQVPWALPEHKPGFVRVSDLRYLSAAVAGTLEPGSRPPNYIATFFAAYRERNPEAKREVMYLVHTEMPDNVAKEAVGRTDGAGGGKGRFVTLRLKDSGNQREFHAWVTPEKGVPLAIDRLYSGAKSSAVVTRWIVGGCAALVAAGITWVGASALLRRGGSPLSSVV